MQPTLIPPEQIPDPWHFDSEALLQELDRIRDLAVQIPPTFNAQIGPINTVINAIWDLRERLQFLIQLHAARQNATQAAFRDAAAAPTRPLPNPPPDILTRYCGDYVIHDLEQLRLSVSRISSFNDPFELHLKPGTRLTHSGAKKNLRSRMRRSNFRATAARRFPGLTRKQLRRTLANARGPMISSLIDAQDSLVEFQRSNSWKRMDHNVRLMCFTEPKQEDPGEIPMWGYYAAKHQGVRVHVRRQFFEQAQFALFPVEYQPEPPELDLSLDPEGKEFNEFAGQIIRSKSCAWRHENEWRLMIPAARCFNAPDSNEMGRDFIRVKPEDICRIDLGIRFDRNLFARADALRKIFPHIEIYTTGKDPQAYYPVYAKRD
jgi:hypothetical protein